MLSPSEIGQLTTSSNGVIDGPCMRASETGESGYSATCTRSSSAVETLVAVAMTWYVTIPVVLSSAPLPRLCLRGIVWDRWHQELMNGELRIFFSSSFPGFLRDAICSNETTWFVTGIYI